MESRCIRITGAREHNLRNLTVEIPRDRLVVVTGLSGSGKSSLAFDTIYAEGQRKYVESLSVHARYFLEQLHKPDVDRIEGLPPTIAIEQRVSAPSPRSTVATTTEIYDFLRLLMSRVGEPHCHKCGRRVYRQTVDQIVDAIAAAAPGTRLMLLAPLARDGPVATAELLRRIQREGFVRTRIDGVIMDVKEVAPDMVATRVDAVVDRLVNKPEVRHRIADAVELSLTLADGVVIAARQPPGAEGTAAWDEEVYSERHSCTHCGTSLPDLSPRAFSFNSPYGACEKCHGLGAVMRFDPELIIPDPSLSLADGAVEPWTDHKGRLNRAYAEQIDAFCTRLGVSADAPVAALSDDARRILLHGTRGGDARKLGGPFRGVIPLLSERLKASADDAARGRLQVFQSAQRCPECEGARLRPEPLAVRVAGRNIHEICTLTIESAGAFFDELRFSGEAEAITRPILDEVRHRLRFMNELGVGYLTLHRASNTLSGGEAQRIRLATQIGSGLVGVCYVLDEPTIGLHQRDNHRLLRSIRRLVEIGNSVIVVEHDEDTIRAADHVIELGPGAGQRGGKITAEGPAAEALRDPNSLTGKYLAGEYEIELPEERRNVRNALAVEIRGARENNLKRIDVRFPLGVFCAVTGVSGSGKSTLVSQILLPALRRRIRSGDGVGDVRAPLFSRPGAHERMIGAHHVDRVIEIDQTPIGRSPRSNPATYTGVFDEIRRLYAKTREAKIRGYQSGRFSFNVKGGRCEACQGQGTRRIEMHFLPDVFVQCQECKGTRYNRETLEIRYRGKSIADVLDMRVEDAIAFFDSFPRIKDGLRALSDVGLGYVRVGQSSNTLSGGEAQRVKLAAELGAPGGAKTLYVLDEPTTGLHFADIHTLLAVLNRLVDKGNTVLVVEHNLDVIKTADWIIDLGPEGGDAGGQVVIAGTPEEVASCAASHTGTYLKGKLRRASP